MKFLKSLMLFMMASLLLLSCSKEEEDEITVNHNNKNNELQLIKTIDDNNYKVEILNNSGKLKVGFNKVYLRLKGANDDAVNYTSISWMPMMSMKMGGMNHQHSCPFSDLRKVSGKKNLLEGYIVFSMASDAPNSMWSLNVTFTVDSQNVSLDEEVNVLPTTTDYNKVFTSGMGNDSTNYLLALVKPIAPKIGSNDIVVALFKKGKNHNFPIVDDYKIKVDPRMPGMNNHSAPGNQDLLQGNDGFYHGKVAFSMSGYWKIDLILKNDSDTTIKGEPVTEKHPESSLNFKLEF